MGMSHSTYMSRQNEITKEYYFHLRGLVCDGLSKANVYKVKQQDGQYAYFLN